ncbi:hypothetical protein HPB50_016306 [Hyalomma asiaticum]|uniref:Uncharacterized protein n=1 Tax=Hyalomma asiaticum TaxID=266040 RepID=A0ACB7T5D1_HYAAI|nr:hypothetical protein HPB50_016306 [Hyalomma asiaticum]
MDEERLLLRVAAANESRCECPLAIAGPAGTHCSGSIALRIGARRCRTLVLSLEAIAALRRRAYAASGVGAAAGRRPEPVGDGKADPPPQVQKPPKGDPPEEVTPPNTSTSTLTT